MIIIKNVVWREVVNELEKLLKNIWKDNPGYSVLPDANLKWTVIAISSSLMQHWMHWMYFNKQWRNHEFGWSTRSFTKLHEW